MKLSFFAVPAWPAVFLMVAFSACAQTAPVEAIPAHDAPILLFNGADLSHFDSCHAALKSVLAHFRCS